MSPTLHLMSMTDHEAAEFSVLQQKLALREAECKELHKQLHEVRGHAQLLQNKLSLSEPICQNLQAELASGKWQPRDQ